MKEPYLAVTFRHGRPLAAYLDLRHGTDQKSQTSRRLGGGLVVDLDRDGVPLGIEITAPGAVDLPALNRVLRDYGLPEITPSDLGPLLAA